jgi:Phytanoyl-CoA dioxygenase (PhyH)
MKGMFHSEALQQQFERDGYVIIDLLNQEQVTQLKQTYFDLEQVRGGMRKEYDVQFDEQKEITYDFTFIDSNIEYKRIVFDKITEVFLPLVNNFLNDYQPIIANFIHKSSEKGEVPLHQNWAFVDEWKYTSVSVWCPLVDSNEANGTLQVVPGSHKRFAPVRGPLIPWELEGLKEDIINDFMVPMNIKAGQAVILDDSIVHYSAPNRTDGLRLAIQLIMIPPGVPSIHYYMDSEGDKPAVKVFEVDKDFYMAFHPWLKPKEQKLVKTLPYKKESYDRGRFEKELTGKAIDQKKTILEKLEALFQ